MDRLQSMRVFVKVADEGGFAAAARALDMSAVTVTRLVADLEGQLGTRLLQRTTRRISLTDAGQIFIERARTIVGDAEEVYDLVRAGARSLAGRLRIQASPVLANNILGPGLAGFLELHPDIRIEIDGATAELLPIEDFDLTLLAVSHPFDASVVARLVIESPIILVAAPSYLRRCGNPARPQDLVQHRILQMKFVHQNSRLLRMTDENNTQDEVEVSFEPLVLANNVETLLRAALDGVGIVPAGIDLVVDHLATGELVRVVDPWIAGKMEVYAALPSRKFVPRRTRAFLDYLIEMEAIRVARGKRSIGRTMSLVS